jgi:hypothetical protein
MNERPPVGAGTNHLHGLIALFVGKFGGDIRGAL